MVHLYNGKSLPLKWIKGSLTGLCEYSVRIARRHSSGRLCLICKAYKKWHLTPNFSLISLWLRKSPLALRMSLTYCTPFVCQEAHSYGTFSIVMYRLFHIVWFCITILVGFSKVCNSDQNLWMSEWNLWFISLYAAWLPESTFWLCWFCSNSPLLISIYQDYCLADVSHIQILTL